MQVVQYKQFYREAYIIWDYVPSFQSPWSTGGVILNYYDMYWGLGGYCDGWFTGWLLLTYKITDNEKDVFGFSFFNWYNAFMFQNS